MGLETKISFNSRPVFTFTVQRQNRNWNHLEENQKKREEIDLEHFIFKYLTKLNKKQLIIIHG